MYIDPSEPYYKWSLEQRKAFIQLRLTQDPELKSIYIKLIDGIASEIKRVETLRNKDLYLESLLHRLNEYKNHLNNELEHVYKKHLTLAVEAGAHTNKSIILDALDRAKITRIDKELVNSAFFRENSRSVKAMWSRKKHGMYLSERLWNLSDKAINQVGSLITKSIAAGEHPTEIAKQMQKYVREGRGSLVSQYPNMMERMGGLTQDLSYEALRLARTETAAAHTDGIIASARLNPSYEGVQWMLSPSHPVRDICDHYAEQDIHGLGKGVYRKGDEPVFPPHPNCLCQLVPKFEKMDDLVDRLIEWNRNPNSQRDIEEWYQNVYKRGFA